MNGIGKKSRDVLKNEVKNRLKEKLSRAFPDLIIEVNSGEEKEAAKKKNLAYGQACLKKIFKKLDSESMISTIGGAAFFLYLEKPETESKNRIRLKLLELYESFYWDKTNEFYLHYSEVNPNLEFLKHVEERATLYLTSTTARLHFYSFVLREIEAKMKYDFENDTVSRHTFRYPKSRKKLYGELRHIHDLPLVHSLIRFKINSLRIRLVANMKGRIESELLKNDNTVGRSTIGKSYRSIANDLKLEITSVFHDLNEKGLVIDKLDSFIASEFVIDQSDVVTPPLDFTITAKGRLGPIIQKLSVLVHRKIISNTEKDLSCWIFYRLIPDRQISLSTVEDYVSRGKRRIKAS